MTLYANFVMMIYADSISIDALKFIVDMLMLTSM